MSRCAIMPRFICCWNPARRAAACSWRRFAARYAGPKLAAADFDPPGRAHPPRRADRCAADRCENHPDGGPCPLKHTEGGDFRQATYRAVRQGLRMAAARGGGPAGTLDDFTLEVPADCVGPRHGRSAADVRNSARRKRDRLAVITGKPRCRMRGLCAGSDRLHPRCGPPELYARRLCALPQHRRGAGSHWLRPDAIPKTRRIRILQPRGGLPCQMGRSSRPRPCVQRPGAQRGTPAGETEEAEASMKPTIARRRAAAYCGTLEQDKELLAIFERTYGQISAGRRTA